MEEDTRTVPAKYVYTDVVGFTRRRSVEAQSWIIKQINSIVRGAIDACGVDQSRAILVPTGDGICVALLNIEDPYDIHMAVALRILAGVAEANERVEDEMLRFELRIGVNANTDNLITDVNGRDNIAGAGINTATRIMSIADGGQILVGSTVHETLRYREKYMNSFRQFGAVVKRESITVFQFVEEGHKGLNTDTPKEFAKSVSEERLTRLAAYFFAHAIKNREFIMTRGRNILKHDALVIWLYFKALDSIAEVEAEGFEQPTFRTVNAKVGSPDEQVDYYDSLHWPIRDALVEFVRRHVLAAYAKYVEGGWRHHLITDKGVDRLRSDWPAIWNEMELDKAV